MKKFFFLIVYMGVLTGTHQLFAQQNNTDTILDKASLQTCIRYALEHEPSVQQYKIDEEITENTIKNKLADWYPQINGGFNVQHYFQLPTAFIPDNAGNKIPIKSGLSNSSYLQFSATQNIFNRDLLLANRTANDVRLQARQLSTNNKIDLVVAVSKAYYDLLLTQKQVQILDENIVRLKRSLQDAYNQYVGGIVDKIDYKRAQIALNNTQADRKRTVEAVNAKYTYLKQLMGYPSDNKLSVVYDSVQMEREVPADTIQGVAYNNRIEYQLLQTEQRLLQSNLKYYKTSYLPNISAFGNYTPNFYNNRFADLYGHVYTTSLFGLQVTIPIFQGGKRIYNVRSAELQLQRLQWGMQSLTDQINTQYAQALAAYKGALAELNALKENVTLAEDVYNTLQLQYNAGIKTYLDVIIAETDLRSAQLNYFNALYNVLSSKLDLQKASGTINY